MMDTATYSTDGTGPPGDGRFRYVIKPLNRFYDLQVAALLASVSDRRLPRLLARSGSDLPEGLPPALYQLPYVDGELLNLPSSRTGADLLFEHIPGRPLQIGQGLDAAGAARLYDEISGALHFLAETAGAPVLHLDIKPQNIVQSGKNRFHLIDWASAVIGERRLEKSYGTEGYLSAERLSGLATVRGDTYALARTVVSLLAKKTAAALTEKDVLGTLRRLPKPFRLVLRDALFDPISLPRVSQEKAKFFRSNVSSHTYLREACAVPQGDAGLQKKRRPGVSRYSQNPKPGSPAVKQHRQKERSVPDDTSFRREPHHLSVAPGPHLPGTRSEQIARILDPYLERDDVITVIVVDGQGGQPRHEDFDSINGEI
jgi:serine/threonine protein kinase